MSESKLHKGFYYSDASISFGKKKKYDNSKYEKTNQRNNGRQKSKNEQNHNDNNEYHSESSYVNYAIPIVDVNNDQNLSYYGLPFRIYHATPDYQLKNQIRKYYNIYYIKLYFFINIFFKIYYIVYTSDGNLLLNINIILYLN